MAQRHASTSVSHERWGVNKGSGQAADHAYPQTNATTTNTIIPAKRACPRRGKIAARLIRAPKVSHSLHAARFPPQLLRVSTMEAESRLPKERESTISVLNGAIEALNLAKELSSITPAQAVFGSVSVILTVIKVSSLLVFC